MKIFTTPIYATYKSVFIGRGVSIGKPTFATLFGTLLLLAFLTVFNHTTYSQFTCGDNVTFFYNGSNVTYGTVLSQGKCWLDRNLGATAVATSSTHTSAYGHLFQWGRGTDGHQIRTSGTTATLSNTDNPGHANFIISTSSPFDWRSSQNNNLWLGVNGTNNPCPSGWRLPTEAEWQTERSNWSNDNAAGAFASALKLTVAGSRDHSNGTLFNVGAVGYYWSQTADGINSQAILFSGAEAGFNNSSRAFGGSVRCIQEDCTPPSITTHPTNQAICAGTNTTFSVSASGTGLTYQWQISTDGGTNWDNQANGGVYSNMTTATMTITGATAGMNNYRYRCVVSGDCAPTATSNSAFLTVQTAPAITTQPTNSTICAGANTTFSVTATGGGLSYQWQLSTNGGGSWTNQANGGVYSGMNTATMTITNATAGMDGYQYRCVVTGTCTPNATSNAGILAVNPINTTTLTSAAGTDHQNVCINTLITNITYNTTGAAGATFSGLPDGITGNWANDVVTISGTPIEIGTFNYTVTLTGGCGNVTANGTITVMPVNTIILTSGIGTDNQTGCRYNPISNITYSTTGAAGATFSGLPNGLTGSWDNDVVTISGTPIESGTFNYTVTLTGGCGNVTANGTILVFSWANVYIAGSHSGNSSQTLIEGTAIKTIYFNYDGATGVGTPTGLPNGVSVSSTTSSITISGTPTETGTFNYSIPLTGGCNGMASGTFDVHVNACAGLVIGNSYGGGKVAYIFQPGDPGYEAGKCKGIIAAPSDQSTGIQWGCHGQSVVNTSQAIASGAANTTAIVAYHNNIANFGGNSYYDCTSGCEAWGCLSLNNGTVAAKLCNDLLLNGYNDWFLPSENELGKLYSKRNTIGNFSSAPYWSSTEISEGSAHCFNFNTGAVNAFTGKSLSFRVRAIRSFELFNNLTIVNSGASTIACGDSTTLTAQWGTAAYTYTWSNSATTPSITVGPSVTTTYTVTATDGGVTETANVVITVTGANTTTLTSPAGTDNQTVTEGTAITNITYSTTGATGIGTPTDLPNGVTASWANDIITISGTPTETGTFNYNVPLTGGCGVVNAMGTITVEDAAADPCSGVTAPLGYGIVASSGKCWLDRNLGATQVATSSADANAYGHLFQWGRLDDGHQIRTSSTESNLSSSNTPGHNRFILAPNSPYDWHSDNNNNRWNADPQENNPCPTGWRVPTNAEWTTEMNSWGNQNSTGAFDSPLKLPVAGNRNYSTGALSQAGTDGTYWSSKVSGTNAHILIILGHFVGVGTGNRAAGFSIRCIKDVCTAAPTTPGTITGQATQNPGATGQTYSIAPVASAVEYSWTVPTGWTITAGQGTTQITVTVGSFGDDGDITVVAINDCGDSGPATLAVTVAADPCSGVTTINDNDGNSYNTVAIGTQCWFAENLKTTKYRTGNPIEYPGTDNTAWTNNTTGAYAWYNNDIGNKTTFGALYNWHAATHGSKLCPPGWKVPTDAEWTTMTDYLQANSQYWCGGTSTQIAKALAATSGWTTHATACNVGNDQSSNNTTGFTALPGGYRSSNGSFFTIGSNGFWWSSTGYSTTFAFYRYLDYFNSNAIRNNFNKANGLSVRCLRDTTDTYCPAPATPGTITGQATQTAGATGQTYSIAPVAGAVEYSWTVPTGWTITAGQGTTQITVTVGSFGDDGDITVVAINDCGDSGPATLAVTVAGPCDGVTTVADSDGNSYATVAIGTQCWFAENLATTKYRTGTPIENVTDNTAWQNNTTGAYAWYNNDIGNKTTYGALYSWRAATHGSKLCPPGWKVPTDAEWTTMVNYLKANSQYWCGGNSTNIGKALAATSGWGSHGTACTVGNDQPSNNTTGFTGRPGGNRNTNGTFSGIGAAAAWWSSTGYQASTALFRFLNWTSSQANQNFDNKAAGFYVRCLRDFSLFSNLTITGNTEICEGSTTTLTAEPGATVTSYSWSPGGQITAAITVSPSVTTTYIVQVVNGGDTETMSVVVKVNGVNSATLSSAAGTDDQTVTVGTAITNITYSTTGATGIGTPTGLPAGVTASWANDVITISGTPTETGTFNYNVPLTGGCGVVNAMGTITVEDADPCDGVTTVADSDGNSYATVAIGTQCWFAENLKTTKYRTGFAIPNVTDASAWAALDKGAYVWYNNNSGNKNDYGALYNWYAVNNNHNLCPVGWRVPTDAEWFTLNNFIDPTATTNITGWVGTDGGLKLKATNANTPTWDGTDAFGFTALPGGDRDHLGAFSTMGSRTIMWSATNSNIQPTTHAFYRILLSGSNAVYNSAREKQSGNSVRCIKDTASTYCPIPAIPTAGNHFAGHNQIVWKWSDVPYAVGYKYSTTGNYNTAIDIGADTLLTQTSLSENTSYTLYVWAYNACGASTELILNATTIAHPCNGITSVVDADNNTYNTLVIGTQCWLKQNLRTTKYSNGQTIDNAWNVNVWNSLSTGAYVWYSNDINFKNNYGALYNWYAVDNPSGLCPTGWKVPSDNEWSIMEHFVETQIAPYGQTLLNTFINNTGWRGSTNPGEGPGVKLKNSNINSPSWDGNNTLGFAAVPAGFRNNAGSYSNMGTKALFWSSTESGQNAFSRELASSSSQTIRTAKDKKEGYAVRCLFSGSACPLPVLTGSITGDVSVCANTGGLTYTVDAVSGVDTYVWTVPTGWSIAAGHGSNTITVVSGAGGQNGNITVAAQNNCGTSTPLSKGVTIISAPAAPAQATHIIGAHQINWHWHGVAGATAYLYSTTDDLQSAISTTDTTHLQTGLDCDGVDYYLYVWAYNDCDTSAYQHLSALTASCLNFTTHPNNEQVCQNENAYFSVSVDGTGLNYQWQVSTNGGTTWNNLSNGGVYSTVTTATLNITGVLFSMDGYMYRCAVSGAAGIPAYSNAANLFVEKAPDIVLPPNNISVCENTFATFMVLADGANLIYEWKESTDGGNTWNTLTNTAPYSGVNTSELTINPAGISLDGNRYRVHVIGTCAPTEAVSIPALLTIATESIITLTSATGTDDQITCTGVAIIPITYSIQSATGATFTGLPQGITGNFAANTVTISGTPQTTGIFNYSFDLMNGCGANTAAIGTITVGSAPQVPVAQAATSITEATFFANWNPVSGATSYRLDVATTGSFTTMLPGYDNLDVSNVTTHQVTGLLCNTQYFYRIRAVKGNCISGNSSAIAAQTLTCTCPNIGDFIDGGYYAYRLQPGDPGYIAGQCVGIILAPNDLTNAEWGCFGQSVGTSTALSSGYNNTLLIVNDCPASGIAADIANNATINSFNDWFLPSLSELQKVYENKDDLGPIDAANYWTSSQESAGNAYVINFTDGVVSDLAKNTMQKVRPIRYLLPPPTPFTSDTVCFGDTIAYYVPPAPGVTHYTWMFTNTSTGITDTLSAYTTNQVQLIAAEDGVLSVLAHNNCGTSTFTRELEIIVYHYGGLEWIGVLDTDWFKPENWASPMAAVKSNNLGCPLRIPGANTHVTVNPDIPIYQPIIHPDSAKGEIAQCFSIYIGPEDSITFIIPNNDTVMTLMVHGHFKLDGRVWSDNDSSFIILRSDTGKIEFGPMLLKSSGDMCRSCIFILEDGAEYTVIGNDAEARKIIIEGDGELIVDDGLTLEVFDMDIAAAGGEFRLENDAELHIAGRIETLGAFDVTQGTVYYNSGSDKWLADSGYVSQTIITTTYKHLKANAGNADDGKLLTIGDGGTIECETFELINMDDYVSQAKSNADIQISSTFNLANTLNGRLLNLELYNHIYNPSNNSSFNMGDSITVNVFYTHATNKAIDITAGSVDFKGTVNYTGVAGKQVMMDNAYNNLGIKTHHTDCYVQMEADIEVNNILTLSSGMLILNEKTLSINNKDTAAIVRNGSELGFIFAETGTKQNLENIVQWNVEDATGTYFVPFGKSYDKIIPFGLNLTANNMGVDGFLRFSTYETVTNNTPYPIVAGQAQIGNYLVPWYVYEYVLNRYWYIDYKNDGGSFIEGRLTMSFLNEENYMGNVIVGPSMMAVRYNPAGNPNSPNPSLGSWVDVIYVQGTSTGMPIVGGAVLDASENSFTTGYITKSQFKNVWLLTNQGTPLPISLLHFNAECRNDKVYVGWATATEINNDYFTLERSTDAVNWQEIAKIDGAGTSSTQNNYYFTDHEPYPGISYYRLTQTDFDGNSEVFTPVDVNCRLDKKTDLIVYPNPFTGIVTIEFVNMPATDASFKIYDALGRIVMDRKITGIEAGYGTITLDLGHLANGVYHLELISEQFIHHEKITKQL